MKILLRMLPLLLIALHAFAETDLFTQCEDECHNQGTCPFVENQGVVERTEACDKCIDACTTRRKTAGKAKEKPGSAAERAKEQAADRHRVMRAINDSAALQIVSVSCERNHMQVVYEHSIQPGVQHTEEFAIPMFKGRSVRDGDAIYQCEQARLAVLSGKEEKLYSLFESYFDLEERLLAARRAIKAGKKPGRVFAAKEQRALGAIIQEVNCSPLNGDREVRYSLPKHESDPREQWLIMKIDPKMSGADCEKLKARLAAGTVANLREDDGFYAAYQTLAHVPRPLNQNFEQNHDNKDARTTPKDVPAPAQPSGEGVGGVK